MRKAEQGGMDVVGIENHLGIGVIAAHQRRGGTGRARHDGRHGVEHVRATRDPAAATYAADGAVRLFMIRLRVTDADPYARIDELLDGGIGMFHFRRQRHQLYGAGPDHRADPRGHGRQGVCRLRTKAVGADERPLQMRAGNAGAAIGAIAHDISHRVQRIGYVRPWRGNGGGQQGRGALRHVEHGHVADRDHTIHGIRPAAAVDMGINEARQDIAVRHVMRQRPHVGN